MGSSKTMPRQAGYASIDRRQKNKSLSPGIDEPDDGNSFGFDRTKSFSNRDSISPPKTSSNKYNTIESRYSPEKTRKSPKYEDYDPINTTGGGGSGSYNQSTLSRGRKAHKGSYY
jgi:hypothetical protein